MLIVAMVLFRVFGSNDKYAQNIEAIGIFLSFLSWFLLIVIKIIVEFLHVYDKEDLYMWLAEFCDRFL